jgi:DNA (cytosine-5)-methyltransferase 1
MKYLSVCSGIEAATVAWHHMGWEAVGYSEIEKFPSQVLAHHYPNVTNYGDMTKFKEWDIGTIDLLVGGTPCQSFSVAGLRKGLDDPRGNLMLTYLAIARQYQPKWLVWENVPGVLSSNGGNDFASFLRGLAELGYGFAYRVLDAQYFGVAQRRRRVFVIGCLGNWQRAAAVLFERNSLFRDTKKSREKREDIAATIAARFGVSRNNYEELAPIQQKVYENHGTDSRIKPVDVCPTVTSRWGTGGNNVPLVNQFEPMTPTIAKCLTRGIGQRFDAETETMIPTYSIQGSGATSQTANGNGYNKETSFTLNSTDVHGIAKSMDVRRLTPVECERLQGFPDNYTDIQLKGKPTPDGPRYKALGNSMAVPVMKWIGERINLVETIL